MGREKGKGRGGEVGKGENDLTHPLSQIPGLRHWLPSIGVVQN